MKNTVFMIGALFISSLSANAGVAKLPTFTLECSKAESGEVKLTSTEKRFAAKEAATMAYQCFVDHKSPIVQTSRLRAIQESQASNPGESCGSSDQSGLELSTISSWFSERPDFTTVKGVRVGEMSGSYVFTIRENFLCSAVGTGLFSGVTASSTTEVNVEENFKFNLNDKKSRQEISVKILNK